MCFFSYFTNRILTDLPNENNLLSYLIKWNTVTHCYSVFRIDLFEKW